MRAAVLTGVRKMEMRDIPVPEIKSPTDVLLEIKRVGVCGSDVHYYTTGRIGSQVVDFPHIVGHECSAVVVETGSAVTELKKGDRVAVEPAIYCHECDQCCAGRENTCRNLKFLACPGELQGCLTEYIVLPAENCFPIPDAMTFEEAALAEPLSIGMYAVQQSIPMHGARIGILGAGPIGLSAMLPAIARGASACYVTDRLNYRCQNAREHGAVWAGNPDSTDIVSTVREKEPLLLDAVFECCGQQEALDQALQILKPGGKLMLIGIPEFDRYTFPADIARRKEICIQNVRRQNGCVQPALEFTAAKGTNPSFMVTHHFPLENTKQAFDLVDNYDDGVIKAMINLEDK
ncbi:MAG: alcohol dehydrogenase catalytic domain-containing protein [Lentisphaeria bacterium]